MTLGCSVEEYLSYGPPTPWFPPSRQAAPAIQIEDPDGNPIELHEAPKKAAT